MDYYLEIKVLPDPEFKETLLINALYSKLHRALGQTAQRNIGVSFPRHDTTLGDTLRLHGTEKQLDGLMAQPWIQGLTDYSQISEILPIPTEVKHRVVRRKQAKSAHNKRRRSVIKGWLSEEEALEKIPDTQQKILKLPFAQLKSGSNGNPMRVYIEHGELSNISAEGFFSSYGLSSTATIPWF